MQEGEAISVKICLHVRKVLWTEEGLLLFMYPYVHSISQPEDLVRPLKAAGPKLS